MNYEDLKTSMLCAPQKRRQKRKRKRKPTVVMLLSTSPGKHGVDQTIMFVRRI